LTIRNVRKKRRKSILVVAVVVDYIGGPVGRNRPSNSPNQPMDITAISLVSRDSYSFFILADVAGGAQRVSTMIFAAFVGSRSFEISYDLQNLTFDCFHPDFDGIQASGDFG